MPRSRTLTKILSSSDQFDLYAGVWDSFDRTNNDDADSFNAGTIAKMSWTANVKVTFPVNDSYTSVVDGSLRMVAPSATSTHGPMLLARTWLTAPGVFGSGSSSYYKQDYEIEIFWEQTPGKIFHAYGMWRDVKIGSLNWTLDTNAFLNDVLGNLVSWDDKTEALCAKM